MIKFVYFPLIYDIVRLPLAMFALNKYSPFKDFDNFISEVILSCV